MFRQMYHLLQQSSQWEQTEAALYIMAAVARNILPDEDSVVPAVLTQVEYIMLIIQYLKSTVMTGTKPSTHHPHSCEADSYQASGRVL